MCKHRKEQQLCTMGYGATHSAYSMWASTRNLTIHRPRNLWFLQGTATLFTRLCKFQADEEAASHVAGPHNALPTLGTWMGITSLVRRVLKLPEAVCLGESIFCGTTCIVQNLFCVILPHLRPDQDHLLRAHRRRPTEARAAPPTPTCSLPP